MERRFAKVVRKGRKVRKDDEKLNDNLWEVPIVWERKVCMNSITLKSRSADGCGGCPITATKNT